MRRSLLGTLVICAGCADQTAILVEVRSPDLVVPLDVDALRIEASGATGTTADETFPLSATWPYSVAVRPGPGDEGSDVTIRVTGLRRGLFVVRRVVQVPFVAGDTRRVTVDLNRDCIDVMCATDVDCVGGECIGAPPDAGVDAGSIDDAGVELDAFVPPDAGVDAGSLADAGPPDAGAGDAGLDAAVFDAGRDAGPGADACAAEICNGVDDDCDTLVDEGLPCVGAVVISELAATGPGGAGDEFLELYNRTPRAIDISGLAISYRSAAGAAYTLRATVPPGTSIAGYGFYLLTSTGYAGATAADFTGAWSSGLAAAGGHMRISVGATDLDLLGWGTAIAPEGTAIAALPDSSPGSYERKANATSTVASMAPGGADASLGNGRDTNDNGADFLQRAARDPQNALAATESP